MSETQYKEPAHLSVRLVRKPSVLDTFGFSKSTLFNRIHAKLFTPPINLSGRCVAWPSTEIDALLTAIIAEKSHDEIKSLVQSLLNQRVSVKG